MKKIISLLLSFMLIISVIPMMASAKHSKPDKSEKPGHSQTESKKDQNDNGRPEKGNFEKGGHGRGQHGRGPAAVPHNHEYNGYGSNPTYHWLECPCGCRINVEPHVDPLETEDDYCFCGYHFSDNADLVTLWVKDCPPIKNFSKDKTEYALNAYTYKDVKEIQIATRTFDSEADVELPEDLTLKEGENKFEVKVTSENKKVTKIYTVIVTKEAKK